MDEDWDAPVPITSGPTNAWDDNEDVADAWDAEPEEPKAKPAPAAAQASHAATGKKALAAKIKEREEQERKAAAQAALRKKMIEEEEARAKADPNYHKNKAARERAQIEASEVALANDLFGPTPTDSSSSSSGPVNERKVDPKFAERAAQLAAVSGLGDGADGFDDVPDAGNKKEASKPSTVSDVDLSTKEKMTEFANDVARKVNAMKNRQLSLHLLKELVTKLSVELKVDEAQELLRVVTVIKNDASKQTQNKKKKPTGKATLKAIGGDYDDYDDAGGYDDYI